VWLPRQLEAIAAGPRPVALLGGEAYGVPFVIDALARRERVAWVGLGRRVHGDPVGEGNALAAALNRLLSARLFAHALPYQAHLQTLLRNRADLEPLWIVLTTERPDAPFVVALLDLHGGGIRVAVDVRAPDLGEGLAARCTVIGPEELRLSQEEAAWIVPGALAPDALRALHRETGGRFTELLERAHRQAGLPLLRVPAAGGPLVAAPEAELVDAALTVRALQLDGHLIEALELAVLQAPELVEGLLRQAGPAYQEHGLLARLHLLLSTLPDPYASAERVLEWRLVAALAADELSSVAAVVDEYLEQHDAPELRARRAGTLPAPVGFPLARAAVNAKRTPLTLWQYGRMHPDPREATELLRESVQLAEDLGGPYDVARSAGSLAAKYLHRGDFARAAAWAEWALQVFDQHRLRDGTRRLMLFNDLALSRIFTGDLVGLRRGLEDARLALEGNLPEVAGHYRSTLAAFELASGRPEAAFDLARATFERSPRRKRSRYAAQYVRALNELGRSEEALRVADDAIELSGVDMDHRRFSGLLARGMARAVARLPGAEADLAAVMAAPDLVAEQRLAAAVHHLFASDGDVGRVPPELARMVRDLHPTALRVLSGPAALFQGVWDTLVSGGPALRLEFLGGVGCRLDGTPVALPPRMAEAALALALSPEGVTRDGLNDFLTPEGHATFTSGGLRGLITRLRTLLPVSEAPYRIAVPYTADVLEVREHLREGRVRDAVQLLRGPLLPGSDAPGVREQRWVLEQEVRDAALVVRDADVLFELGERLGEDLEVWEAVASAMPSGDPRSALAHARVRRLAREYGVAPLRT
jgi:tetratricopeptide (TPR) repeat protein